MKQEKSGEKNISQNRLGKDMQTRIFHRELKFTEARHKEINRKQVP